MARPIVNIAASVGARLRTHAREKGQPFDLTLTRYAIERLLYRLSVSADAGHFVLKGAMLLTTWFHDPMRPTRDLDLLGFGDPDAEKIVAVFRAIMAMGGEDGVAFDHAAIRTHPIREANAYGGVRLRTTAVVGGAKNVPVAIDIAFGDAFEPGLEEIDFPVLLDQPAPRLQGYARETVIAEKFQAIVILGRANSRMKDYYDLWLLADSFAFEHDRLACAIRATFNRRGTEIPADLPDGLTEEFGSDPRKVAQWQAFVRDLGAVPGSLVDVCARLAAFLMPHAEAARGINSTS